MIVRIVHGTEVPASPDADTAGSLGLAPVRADSPTDRARLARAAAKVAGLETLIVGWRSREEAPPDASDVAPACVVVLVWLDVESMVAAATHESTFLSDRLGLRIAIERGETYEVSSRTFGSLPTPSAVVRIVTLRARPSVEAALFERLRDIQTRLTALGLIASHVARRVGPEGIEAVVISVWSDDDAIEAATGGRIDRPAFGEEIDPWVDAVAIDTYRAVEIAPRLPMSSGPAIVILDGSRRIVDLTPAAAAVLGQTQDEAVGMSIEALGGHDGPAAAEDWLRPSGDQPTPDEAGESAWSLHPSGHVMLRWRLRRDVPVPGRHTLLVHRRHEPEPTAEALDAALDEAFPQQRG
jgi:PAS domain-containing protein